MFEEVERMDQFINPSFHIPFEITKITILYHARRIRASTFNRLATKRVILEKY